MKKDNHQPYGPYEKWIKRPMDCIIACLFIVLLMPLMLILTLVVRIRLGSPIIFIQERPGLNGHIFKMYKFRTMTDGRDADGKLLPDKERITKLGTLLRRTSLDELPELFNIVRGDMSFIGPRPLLVRYLPRYDERQQHRHDVRPGLTGAAQVNGRNLLSWEDKFEYDLNYVEKITFLTDVSIFIKTIFAVFRHDEVKMDIPEFLGIDTQIESVHCDSDMHMEGEF